MAEQTELEDVRERLARRMIVIANELDSQSMTPRVARVLGLVQESLADEQGMVASQERLLAQINLLAVAISDQHRRFRGGREECVCGLSSEQCAVLVALDEIGYPKVYVGDKVPSALDRSAIEDTEVMV